MTVSKIVPVNTHSGDGSVIQFDFDFLIENEKELIVKLQDSSGVQTTLTRDVDYSIHEVGNTEGSYITYPLAGSSHSVLASDEKIILALELDISQEKEIHNSNKFNLNILEWCFDYVIRLLQILNRKIERSIKIPEGSDILPDNLIESFYENMETVENDKNTVNNYKNQTQQIYEQTQTLVGADYNRVYDTLINIDNKATNAAASAVSATQSASAATLRAEEANLYAQTAGASATTATNAADLLSDIYEEVISLGSITVPSIDTSLSVSGAAADAASVGKYTDKLDVYGSSTTYTNTATSSINPAYTWFLYFEDDMYVKSWTPVITSAYITYRFAKSATDVADDVDIVYTSDTYTAEEGDTIPVNRILGKRSFIVITGGEIKYTASGQSYNIKAHLASLTSGNKAEMVTALANDYHSGTFIFEDRFDNIPTKTEVDNISNELTTYGKTLTYTNTSNATTQGSAYWILFFDDSKYVKSWTPELAEGSHIFVSFGKTNEDIADNVQGTIIGPPIVLGCGDTLNINRYMTPHDFLFISGNPKYTSSAIPFSINARIAASDITGKFSMVSDLKYDHHAGTFVLEDRFDNVATLKDVNTISNELNNYGQVISYTNTKNADTDGSAWFALYFNYETYVKSWTPSYNGSSIQYAFASASSDIADEVSLQVETVYTAANNETINIERYFTKKDCLLVKGNIGYGWGQYQNTAINARLALYANSSMDCSNFASNVFAGTFELSQQIYKGLPTVSFVEQRIKDSEKNSSRIYPCSMSLFSNFGVIGDSYGCGQAWTQGGTLVNGYEQSWEKILGRMTGATVYPFCISGSTTESWLANGGEHGLAGLLAAPPLQLYILGHVINDANVGLTIGDISDIEDVSDPTSLPSTFINNMAKIRYYCLQRSPKAKIIFMLSDGYTYNYINKSAYDAATIQVANYYNTPYINQHDHPYYALDVYKNLTTGHPTVQGYTVMAKAIKDLIEECMGKSNYTNYFNLELQS
jgi:hypothetical protein